MQKTWIIVAMCTLAAVACKRDGASGQTSPIKQMAKDVCACVTPVIEISEKAQRELPGLNEQQAAPLEAEIEKVNDEASKCFGELEKKYGSLEGFQYDIMETLKKDCPKVYALLSGQSTE